MDVHVPTNNNQKHMKLTLLTLLTVMSLAVFAQEQRVMTLQECVELATENNLNVQRSRLNLETAETNLKQTEFQQYPNANAGGSFGYSWGRSIDPTSNQFITQRINSTNLNASSGVNVFSGFQLANSIKQNRKDLQAAGFDVEKSTNDVQLNIVTFYLNVIFNKELLENASFQLQSSQNQLDRTEILVEAGSLPRSNELELISQVATGEVNVVTAENNLTLAYLILKQAMLLPVSDNIDVEIPDAQVEALDLSISPETVFGNAEQTLPEIKAADLRVTSAEFGYEVSRGGLYPSLRLNGGLRTNYSDARIAFNPDGGGAFSTVGGLQTINGVAIESFSATGSFETVGFGTQFQDNLSRFLSLNLSIPIFNGLSQRSTIQRSKIAMQQATINALEQRNFLRQIIESAYTDAVASSKTYAASTRQVETLEETFRSIENQYNLGASNFTDYQVASNNLFQAKSDQTRAKFDFIFKKKLLDFYQGKPIF